MGWSVVWHNGGAAGLMHDRLNCSSANECELRRVDTRTLAAGKLADCTKDSCDKTVDGCLVCATLIAIVESERRTGRHE